MKLGFFTIVIALFFTNCSIPTHMKLSITSTQNANLDSEGISSPVMLKFYELKSAEKFTKLDFWALTDNADEKLGDNLISQTKHIIVPNSEQVYKIIFDDEAKFLGIIASFQDIDNKATWRFINKLAISDYESIDLIIDENHLKEDN